MKIRSEVVGFINAQRKRYKREEKLFSANCSALKVFVHAQ